MEARAKDRFVFVDRPLATLVSLCHGTTHDVLACWFGVDRSTTTARAIGEVRPLLVQRGCTVAPDVRLRTFAEVIDHLGASGQTGIIDGMQIRVRRPVAGRKGRDKSVSGKTKQNAVKTMLLTDAERHVLFCSPVRPGICASITQARQAGLAHNRRQPCDPVLRHDQFARPSPIMHSSTSCPGTRPRPTVHEVVRSVKCGDPKQQQLRIKE
ncbi:transposase (plasmid) [Streptomyces sp. NBC_00015]|uniref:transposase family protein n=1 Tax=unclassified Streptomyces TaxID=2593676 RepID=UPI002F916967